MKEKDKYIRSMLTPREIEVAKKNRMKIPKMSAKWLQDLWDKRKERECA